MLMSRTFTDSKIITAANIGARYFLKHFYFSDVLGSENDVLQEGYVIAFQFARTCDDASKMTPFIISQRVIYGLIDLLRKRLKYRWRSPKPRFVKTFEGWDGIDDPATEAVDLADAFDVLETRLTKKEAMVFNLMRGGLTQAQISRKLGVSKSCVAKRLDAIRNKLTKIL